MIFTTPTVLTRLPLCGCRRSSIARPGAPAIAAPALSFRFVSGNGAAIAISLLLAVCGALLFPTPLAAADSPANLKIDPGALLRDVEPGLVRVELDLQFDRGEAPTGVLDHDPGSRVRPMHRLTDVIEQERPLETCGYLVAPRTVVAMDPCIHPRFIRAIHVRTGSHETRAQVIAYGLNQWMMVLRLDEDLPETTPIRFTTGEAALVATAYRAEGVMYTELLPLGSRYQKPVHGSWHRVGDHQGVALSRTGEAVGMVLSKRLPLNDSWQGSPLQWATVTDAEYQEQLLELRRTVDHSLLRIRLSFRSPTTPSGSMMDRRRFGLMDGDDDEVTELDAIGVAVAENQVLVLANLKPTATARLERVQVHPMEGPTVNAQFVASLRHFGGLIVATENASLKPVSLDTSDLPDWTERLVLRANLLLQGEHRTLDTYHGRIATLSVGPRLEPYPELIDMSDADRAFLFSSELKLVALPMAPRLGPASQDRWFRSGPDVSLIPSTLLARILADLAKHADPANVPVSEEDENRLAWLGVELQPLTRELARANSVADQTQDGDTGALVTYVHPNSPAADAGLEPGAILLRVSTPRLPTPIEVDLDEDMMGGEAFPWDRLDEVPDQFYDRIPTPWAPAGNDFIQALTQLGFGTPCTLYFVQGGQLKTHDFEIQPGPRHFESSERLKLESTGLTLRNLTYEVRRYTRTGTDDPGVIVSRIEQGSRASIAGLKPYELITHVNDDPVFSIADFESLMKEADELRLSVRRMGKGRIVTIRP